MPVLARIAAHKTHFRHAVRVVAAALVAYGLNLWLGLEQGYWMVFTAIIVMQASVGGSVKAAVERMTGTLFGAFYGVLILMLVPRDTHLMFAFSVFIGLAPMAIAASMKPAFRIAPITVAILLFGNAAQHMGPLAYAEWRVLEICIGCVIGLATAVLVFPARAHSILAGAVADVLDMTAVQLSQLLENPFQKPDLRDSHKKLRLSVSKLDDIATEARRESASYLTSEPEPEPLLRMVRRVRNDVIMITRALDQPLPQDEKLGGSLKRLSQGAGKILASVALALKNDTPAGAMPDIDEAFVDCAAVIHDLRREEVETSHIAALAFALEQLKRDLKDLTLRADEFITAN